MCLGQLLDANISAVRSMAPAKKTTGAKPAAKPAVTPDTKNTKVAKAAKKAAVAGAQGKGARKIRTSVHFKRCVSISLQICDWRTHLER